MRKVINLSKSTAIKYMLSSIEWQSRTIKKER